MAARQPTVGDSTRSIEAFLELLVGHSDYMQTKDFKAILANVIELALTDRVALMCADAVQTRCRSGAEALPPLADRRRVAWDGSAWARNRGARK